MAPTASKMRLTPSPILTSFRLVERRRSPWGYGLGARPNLIRVLSVLRRGTTVRLVAFTLALSAVAFAVAFFIPWMPEQASKNAKASTSCSGSRPGSASSSSARRRAHALLGRALPRRPDDETDGPPIHGHTGLEIVWTAIPTLLVIVDRDRERHRARAERPARPGALRVSVTAQQFAWTFSTRGEGPDDDAAAPPGRPRREARPHRARRAPLVLGPEFGQKQDAVPGQLDRARDHADEDRRRTRHLHRALRARPRADALAGRS